MVWLRAFFCFRHWFDRTEARQLALATVTLFLLAVSRTAAAAEAGSPGPEVDTEFTPEFEPLPVPPTADERASAIFMNRALSFYAAQERYRRLYEGSIGVGFAMLLGVMGGLVVAGADTKSERALGFAELGMSAGFLGAGITRLALPSDLEELRSNYISWRADRTVPTYRAVNQARENWRQIAHRERAVRRTTGWIGLVLAGAGGMLAVAYAVDKSSNTPQSMMLGLYSTALGVFSARLLFTETPAESGYRAWLVYVQSIPAATAGTRGSTVARLPWMSAVVGISGAM